jgi:hypothetical protein
MKKSQPKRSVPLAMQVQLARLFGSTSKIAQRSERSDDEWRRDLKLVLDEIESYLLENVFTEASHLRMITSGLDAARRALDEADFWPGYTEGITRIALCLLGNYPDHRKRRGGAKKSSHYDLRFSRTMMYSKDRMQMLRLLTFEAPVMGVALSIDPFEALREFRDGVGFTEPQEHFLNWFKEHYPSDWSKVF